MPKARAGEGWIGYSSDVEKARYDLAEGIVRLWSNERPSTRYYPLNGPSLFTDRLEQEQPQKRDWLIEDIVPDLPEIIDMNQVDMALQSKGETA